MELCVVIVAVFVWFPTLCDGHGYLRVPPQRSSFWRERSDMQVNYQDNQLNCGGYHTQFDLNAGKCGVCGDPYGGPLYNQPPGKFATGEISRCYKLGTTHIEVELVVTANHMGTIQLRLCPHNNVNVPATQECLDKNVLQLESMSGLSHGTTYRLNDYEKYIYLRARLPINMVCSQCVLQWTYASGNNWGCDTVGCGIGYGNQEHFVNCADISILNECPVITTTTKPPTTWRAQNNPKDWVPRKWVPWVATKWVPEKWVPKYIFPKAWSLCVAANEWTGQWKVDKWCTINCPMGHCPKTHCFCPDL